MNSICYKYNCLSFLVQILFQGIMEDIFTHIWVESTQAVVN